MKISRIILLVLITIFASCTNNDTPTVNELDGLTKVQEITNDTHIIEVYSTNDTLQQGYNAISLRIKNKTTNEYEKSASVTWAPLMYMTAMKHACPYSLVTKTLGKEALYDGYIVFQMAENATEYWELAINYTINGTAFTAKSKIGVPKSKKQRITTFNGTDGGRYILALIEPKGPKEGLNDMTVGVFKMKDMTMMQFPVVDNFKVKIDPRMPSMGNHTSPNNVDLAQVALGGFYQGKLALTMTGYWRINLQLLNASNEVLKGETIVNTDPSSVSSLYFEIEF
jgi:hypothetical protein